MKVLVQFMVHNYDNLGEEMSFSLNTTRDYDFGTRAVKDQFIKTAMVFGGNGGGKTELGRALLDITRYLTERRDTNSFNASKNTGHRIRFQYDFHILQRNLQYRYERRSSGEMLQEEFLLDNRLILYYDHVSQKHWNAVVGGTKPPPSLSGKNISYLKYILNHLEPDHGLETAFLKLFHHYVERMFFFSVPDMLADAETTDRIRWAEKLVARKKVKDFESFLHRVGINGSLGVSHMDGNPNIVWRVKQGEAGFFSLASSGMITLAALYSIIVDMERYSFLYLDDFDAFLNPNVARIVFSFLLESDSQVVVTTHNSQLIDNGLLRPDCYFQCTPGYIRSFSELSNKDIKESHHLENLFRAGHFN